VQPEAVQQRESMHAQLDAMAYEWQHSTIQLEPVMKTMDFKYRDTRVNMVE
jgi:hypothetical protein